MLDLAAIRNRLTDLGRAAVVAPEADFYTLADWAILRTIMGEDLRRLPADEREPWLERLLAAQSAADGSFPLFHNHSSLHANGTAVGGIGALGGRCRHPVRLYEPFADAARLRGWLEHTVDWTWLWGGSHLFWGGVHCFALTAGADEAWKETAIAWLDREADPATGWWRRGVAHSDRHQSLGGAVHILPIYQHLGRRYPYIERAIDSTLALQLPGGHWLEGQDAGDSYLELDALYMFALGRYWAPGHRPDDVQAATARHAALVVPRLKAILEGRLRGHVHHLMAVIGILGIHRQLDPARFVDDRPWSDIFSDPALYRDVTATPLTRQPRRA